MINGRIEALVIARGYASAKPLARRELASSLVRYAPVTLAEAAWRAQLEQTIEDLRARDVLDEAFALRDRDELARAIGSHTVTSWRQLTDRVLPALGLGVAPGDAKAHAKLAGRDDWTAAIMARALGLWSAGPPPSLATVCDAYAWQELGLAGKPKRCPAEVRAVFVQRALGSDAGPPDRQVRLFAANAVAAPRPELRAIRDALVRNWCAGKVLGDQPFAAVVREAASAVRAGTFGDRKVFIAAVWNELRSRYTLADFKARLVTAHRAGELVLARADLVAAMDPELVAASETTTNGASFHFIVREVA
ncbi:MAG: hypothetical protein ABI867_18200 [Kofleriaceae bacterium]